MQESFARDDIGYAVGLLVTGPNHTKLTLGISLPRFYTEIFVSVAALSQ